MKKVLLVLVLIKLSFEAFAQAPSNDECLGAIQLPAENFCSAVSTYTTVNATEKNPGNGKDIWFKFTAISFEVSITVTANTLRSPTIGLKTDCNTDFITIGSVINDGNNIIYTKGGLTPGIEYFFWVGGATPGTFQLCIKNYNPPVKPGQDYSSASILCSTASFPAINITGAGLLNHEADGTCLETTEGEANTAWYKWTAANNGTLVFTITPTKNDDIDWVLFDLGLEGNTTAPSGKNAIRCAAGAGISHESCPGSTEALYNKTGLDFNETDISEEGGCGKGQNGVVKAVTMQQGHVYALLINNFSNGNNGFNMDFSDRNGRAGTGEFAGPKGTINLTKNQPCTVNQSFTFTTTTANTNSIKWYFGNGASLESSDVSNPPVISYSNPGEKTVVLQLTNERGCSVVYSQTFLVGLKPDVPSINPLQISYCTGDVITLGVAGKAGETYSWTGPSGFKSDLAEVKIPVTTSAQIGTYSVIATLFGCSSDAATTTINSIIQTPIAAFTTDPTAPAKLAFPVTVKLFNNSQNADSFSWDFGDGTPLSTETNPEHVYKGKGNFTVTLTAFNSKACSASTTKGTFMVSELGSIFIPNTFTPNNDSVNDEFVVNMNNIKTFQIQIFNRYGILMYSSQNLVENWDGTYKNEQVPVGTYYYVLDAIDFDNNLIKKSGSVTILR
ncbi:MAG: gliding motility-associated C-terminal domain-containing protein [Daejeonella sp.]|uniref:T9SS type B sorting domain-containing protein n=1 Tax=Daejeonella sp. TaxID=2805397 RepID=UPI003C75721A